LPQGKKFPRIKLPSLRAGEKNRDTLHSLDSLLRTAEKEEGECMSIVIAIRFGWPVAAASVLAPSLFPTGPKKDDEKLIEWWKIPPKQSATPRTSSMSPEGGSGRFVLSEVGGTCGGF
jgi:hypothetical protein